MAYRLASFDFDGTLANTFPWFQSVANQFADRYGFRRIEPGEEETLRGWDSRRLLQHFNVSLWKLPLLVRELRAAMARDIHTIRLFEGIGDAILGLAEHGIQLAIVSSNSLGNVRHVLGDSLAQRFQH